MDNDGKKYLNPVEAARFIGVAPQTLAKWRCTGLTNLPFIRVGSRRISYAVDDLENFMNARRVSSTSEVVKAA